MYLAKGYRSWQGAGEEATEERLAENLEQLGEDRMDAVLDAGVQFIQMGLMLVIVVQNFALRARMKRLEDKIGR